MPRGLLPVVAALLIGGVAGPLLVDEGDSPATDGSEGPSTRRVAFHGRAGTNSVKILDLGGLRIAASCREFRPGPYLSVAASTLVDDAIAAATFTQRGPGPSTHTFVQSDFDRAYGQWDFLGSNPNKTVGTLHYARPDGGQVEVRFLADQGTAQGDCVFAGIATYVPADDEVEGAAPANSAPRSQSAALDASRFVYPGGGGAVDPSDNLVCVASIRPGEAGFQRCQPGSRGGGYDVWIRGVACAEIRRMLPIFGFNPRPGRSPFFATEQGWMCWAKKEGRAGPIHHVCFRDGQVVMYEFA